MLRAEEFRLRNWIARGGNGEHYRATAETISDLENGHIKPTGIPLTEEWLNKFGFGISNDNGTSCIRSIGNFAIVEDCCYGALTYVVDGFGIEIKTVHQLQNLYFALTGEELTIKVEEE